MIRLQFSDGTNHYDFGVHGITVTDYNPGVKPRTVKKVEDSIEIVIASEDASGQQTTKDAINNWLSVAAELSPAVNESKIWLRFKRPSETDWRVSPIMGGVLKSLSLGDHSQLKERYEIQLTRLNFWEWPEVELGLSGNPAGPFVTSALTVTNQFTPLFIDPAMAGDGQAPTPIRLTVAPYNSPSPIPVDSFYLFHNAYSTFDAYSKVHLLEGEDSTLGGSDTLDTDSLGDYYRLVTWGGGGTDSAKFAWDLSADLVASFGGRWYRVIARVGSTPTEDLYAKVELNYPSGSGSPHAPQSEIYVNAVTGLGFRFLDLGAIQLPPVGMTPKPPAIEIALNLRSAAADSFGIDFVILCPADSFLQATAVSLYNAFEVAAVIFDGYIGRAYVESDDQQFIDYQEIGQHPGIIPGRANQFITFAHDNRVDGADINQIFNVTATYKPRRLTV